jgi:DNA mismatch repair protein MLH1
MLLTNVCRSREELFYQLGLRQFGDMSRLKLQPAPSLRGLLEISVGAEESTKESNLTKEQIVEARYSFRSVCVVLS